MEKLGTKSEGPRPPGPGLEPPLCILSRLRNKSSKFYKISSVLNKIKLNFSGFCFFFRGHSVIVIFSRPTVIISVTQGRPLLLKPTEQISLISAPSPSPRFPPQLEPTMLTHCKYNCYTEVHTKRVVCANYQATVTTYRWPFSILSPPPAKKKFLRRNVHNYPSGRRL